MARIRKGLINYETADAAKIGKSGNAKNMKQNKCEMAGPKRKAPEMAGT